MNHRILTLHIGTGKAGSTSLQQALTRLDPVQHGVATVPAFGLPNATQLTMACNTPQARRYFVDKHAQITPQAFETLGATVWAHAHEQVRRSPAPRFAASSEFLCTMVRGLAIAGLKQQLDQIFDQVRIVVYLRDQRSFLRSLWAQSVKGPSRSGDSFQHFMDTLHERRRQWNYSLFLKEWSDIFGAENLSVTMFDPKALHQGDVVADFLHKTGAQQIAAAPRGKQNVTPDHAALEQIRQANLGSSPDQPEAAALDPARYESLVLDRVSAGNAWVNDRFFRNQQVKLPTL